MMQYGYQGGAIGARRCRLRWKMRFILLSCGHTACRFLEQSRDSDVCTAHLTEEVVVEYLFHHAGMCYVHPRNILRFKFIPVVQGLCIPQALCYVNQSALNGAIGTFLKYCLAQDRKTPLKSERQNLHF